MPCATAPRSSFSRCASATRAAIALYEDEGFVRVARRARYYPVDANGVREDALVMRRDVVQRK